MSPKIKEKTRMSDNTLAKAVKRKQLGHLYQKGSEAIKLSLFACVMSLYLENPRDLPERRNESLF